MGEPLLNAAQHDDHEFLTLNPNSLIVAFGPGPWPNIPPKIHPPPLDSNEQLLRDLEEAVPKERGEQYTIRPEPVRSGPYDPFFIPDSILLHGPVSPQTKSAFLQLPPELLTLILKKVKIPYFQVSLALTCKTMARIAAQKDVLSPWRGYRDKDGLFRLLERKNNYIPPHLRLCRGCFRFLPRNGGEYWDKQMTAPIFDRTTVNWYDLLMWFQSDTGYGHRCPQCCVLKFAAYASEGTYQKQRAKETLSEYERTCPDLHRRIDRP
ncbi:uncharacterized protein PV07_06084 [Cladophialophora immunda]|uniref:F-box domain-containing protein n=1 Tax=Cladophialophora immunda TaxID=569365 RepID=A0A0D2D3P6_9EURO|nr:uncharacterized protein PV07_06084 [Cladophialophora immunda]KIW30334.1 hypothetical protein PV07_06084 [Cladophialophora immunda]OQU95678.1 hypothetical protein CLAIMM_01859 [Cladophialophora immunda]